MGLATTIGYISLLLISGSIIAKIGEKLNIPDIPLLLIYGLIVGPFLGIISTSYAQDIFGYVANIGLIIILLGGAFEMRWIVLKRVLKTVLKYLLLHSGQLILSTISPILIKFSFFKKPINFIFNFFYGYRFQPIHFFIYIFVFIIIKLFHGLKIMIPQIIINTIFFEVFR